MDIPNAFAAARSKDATENNGALDRWTLISYTEKQARISLGEGLCELVISLDEDGNVQLDFNNEDVNMTEVPGMIGNCVEDLERSPAESIAAAIFRIFEISGIIT